MTFAEKIKILRKTKGFSQEQFAEKINVSRQAVAKWEAGLGIPEIDNLVSISSFFSVSIDYLVKDQSCEILPAEKDFSDIDELISFRLEANVNTYAAKMNEVKGTRSDSVDFHYEKNGWTYHDTYVGGEQFTGEEAIWKNGKAVYGMNYMGRVLDSRFSGDFLKEALRSADREHPFRGSDFYEAGEYTYKSSVSGNINWYQGYEEIFLGSVKLYECFFHGCILK